MLPGAKAALQSMAVPSLVTQALSSKVEPKTSLRCLLALAKADADLQTEALSSLGPAALQQITQQSLPHEHLDRLVQLIQATEDLMLAGSPNRPSSADGAFAVAEAVLAAATGASDVQPQAASALARLTTAAAAACTPELQMQLVASATHCLQSQASAGEASRLVRLCDKSPGACCICML